MPTQLLSSMSTRGKVTIAVSALAFVVVAFLLLRLAGAPSYSTVAAGMDPAETTKVTSALDAAGVKYEIRRGGTELAVEKGMETDARLALSKEGIAATGVAKQPGFELLDKQKLGASSFQQQVAYQRALEGQIAQTIGSIDGVGGAQVRLTLPKDELFADEAKPATAAVLLTGRADELDPASVKGVASLVASSVPDLDPKKVTITDGAGQLVWPQGDGTGSDVGGTLGKPAAEARYASQLEGSLDALLVRTLGPGKATVQVAADLDLSESTQEKLQYAKKGVPLKETTETESLTSEGGATGSTAGTTANIPTYAAGAGGTGGESNYRKTTAQRDLGVDKTVTRTKIAPGAVQRLDVAVLVDKKVPAADVAALKTALTSAAGIRADRGDTLAVSQVAFAAEPAATPAAPAGALPIPAGMEGIVKGVALGLGALLFLFFISRHLRKREADPFADEPSWLRALPLGDAPAALPAPKKEMEAIDLSPPDEALNVFKTDPRAMALEELVAREPERVAGQLRSWITEEK